MISWICDISLEAILAALEWMWDERGILRYLAVLVGIGLAGFLIWHIVIL